MTVSTLTVVPEASASGTAPCAEPHPRRRPRVLDLFCGGGGASAGYHAAGFDVVGVDIAPQPHYPFPFLQADALAVDLSGFDVVAASPPCQKWCASTPSDRRHAHPDLLGPIRDRLRAAVAAPGGPWAYVIENVPGAPLLNPVTICGDTLRLGVRRHRLFESNLPLVGTPCCHDRPTPPVPVYGTYGQRAGRKPADGESGASTEQAREAMGINWMPWPALTQAIPPAYTHWLGVQLLLHRHVQVPSVTARRRLPSLFDHQPDTTAGDSSPTAVQTSHPTAPVQVASVTPASSSTGLRHCRCGQPLTRPATGRWPRYCSHACRQAAYRDRHRRPEPQP